MSLKVGDFFIIITIDSYDGTFSVGFYTFTDREDGEKKEECEVEIDSIDLSTRYVPNVET